MIKNGLDPGQFSYGLSNQKLDANLSGFLMFLMSGTHLLMSAKMSLVLEVGVAQWLSVSLRSCRSLVPIPAGTCWKKFLL
jgi:hypothetical protein